MFSSSHIFHTVLWKEVETDMKNIIKVGSMILCGTIGGVIGAKLSSVILSKVTTKIETKN